MMRNVLKRSNQKRCGGADRSKRDYEPGGDGLAGFTQGPNRVTQLSAKPRTPGRKRFLRSVFGSTSVVTGAAIVTLGLMATMVGLISEDFEPQDTIALADMTFTAVPDDIAVIETRTPPKLRAPIEVPPPPPSRDIIATDRPSEPVYDAMPPNDFFSPGKILIPTSTTLFLRDEEPTPIRRLPPVMPINADRSGRCLIVFDVGPDGKPYNIQAPNCSQSHFERPAIRSVANWRYRPKIQDGFAVTRTGLRTTIRFNLVDARGDIIPE